ncbi:GCN5-related N-acetyltransferase [Clostridium sp. DL-VIII]|nr:GCN5-related N-acetyltransferase [Clostridium sp. DL-VIII]
MIGHLRIHLIQFLKNYIANSICIILNEYYRHNRVLTSFNLKLSVMNNNLLRGDIFLNSNIIFRNIEKSDTESLWNMMNQLDYETKFMLYEPGERTKNLSRLQGNVDSAVDGNNLFFIAADGNEIIGYIAAQIGNVKREQHSAYIVVGIREKYRNQGIGTKFFNSLDEWAVENRIVRLELTVLCTNKIALNLYKKNGFEIEGTKRKSMYIDGEYVDEYYMSKIIR